MLNPAARDDVLRLIELRSRFDECQRLLLEQQTENGLLRTINAELHLRLSQADDKNNKWPVDTDGYLAKSQGCDLGGFRFTTTCDLAVEDDAGK